MSQPTLWDAVLEAKWHAFHEANPHVYRLLRDEALKAKRAGLRRFGMKALFERLRWISQVETVGDPYRLNNNYTAFYARLLMESEPALRGFFETRESGQAHYARQETA